METIGGHLTPAVGGACGVERIIAVMKAREIPVAQYRGKRVFLAHAGELAKQKAFGLAKRLRDEGIVVLEALVKDSLGAQLKTADKERISIALILGKKRSMKKASSFAISRRDCKKPSWKIS